MIIKNGVDKMTTHGFDEMAEMMSVIRGCKCERQQDKGLTRPRAYITDLAKHPLYQGVHEKNGSSTSAWLALCGQSRETVKGRCETLEHVYAKVVPGYQ
jgi:hypothetical protein